MIKRDGKALCQYAGKLSLILGVALTLTACEGNANGAETVEHVSDNARETVTETQSSETETQSPKTETQSSETETQSPETEPQSSETETQSQNSVSREYAETDYMFSDSNKLLSRNDKMEYVNVGDRTYNFQQYVSEEDRESCIESTERILDYLGFGGELTIYVYADENAYYIDEDGLYTYLAEWNSVDYAAAVIHAVYGRYVNYGAAYGYADYICNRIWGLEFAGEQPKFDAEYNCYDLNLLCFDENFVTADEVAEAKAVSRGFASDYIEKNGEDKYKELLTKSGDLENCGEFNAELESWYREQGLDLEDTLSELLYTYGGHVYQYIVTNGHAVFCVDRDWKDTMKYGENSAVTENFLHEDYGETKKFYDITTEQMKQYKELFQLKENKMNVPVAITNKKVNAANASYYSSDIGVIYLRNISSLMHEYVHALCDENDKGNLWSVEGFATAYGMRYNFYAYDFLSTDYNYYAASELPRYAYLRELIENNGRPIDFAIDYIDIDNLITYFYDVYDPNYNYSTGASFIYYLNDIYGERKIIDYICDNHDLTTFTDKTYDELVEDWKAYMEKKYSGYSKNK